MVIMANDTLQKFKSSFNRGVTTISIKTSSSLEKVKIKTHIDSIQSEIDNLIVSSGRAAYAVWESEEKDYSVLNEPFELIRQKKEEIANLQREYDSIDERDSQILGTQFAEEPKPVSPAPAPQAHGGIVCPSCGSTYTTAVKFCRKCGQRLQE